MEYFPLCTVDYVPEVVILANGEFPASKLGLTMLGKASAVVCCDGAAVQLISYGRIPQAIVGDGDSLPEVLKKRYASLFYQKKEQETNDLTKAFHFCQKQGWERMLILGATGKREDHTLGNISLLADYAEQAKVEMLTDYGLFTPFYGDAEFETFSGQQVSVFNKDCTDIKGEGLVYPLSAFTNWWEGTLNEATGNCVRIFCDGRALVYRAH